MKTITINSLPEFFSHILKAEEAMGGENELVPSGFTLAGQIEGLHYVISAREYFLGWAKEPPGYKRETDCLRAALRTLQALVDDGK